MTEELKEPAKKRPGRPKGSKNKPREEEIVETIEPNPELVAEEKEQLDALEGKENGSKTLESRRPAPRKTTKKTESKITESPKTETKKSETKKTEAKNKDGKKTEAKRIEDPKSESDSKKTKKEKAEAKTSGPQKRRGRPPKNASEVKELSSSLDVSENISLVESKEEGAASSSKASEFTHQSINLSENLVEHSEEKDSKHREKNTGEKQGTTVYVNTLVGMVPVAKKEPKKNQEKQKKRNGKTEEQAVKSGDEDFLNKKGASSNDQLDTKKLDDVLVAGTIRAVSEPEVNAASDADLDSDSKEAEREINGIPVDGIFEYADSTSNTGYGFLRKFGISTEMDIYVSPMFTKKFGLKNGEHVRGYAKKDQGTEKYRALVYVSEVNGMPPYLSRHKNKFDDMTPLFPKERLNLSKNNSDIAMRIIDLIAPVGKGQRGLIVAPPKSGKTILLQKIAKAIRDNYPEIELMILLIDERPEEVTDMKEEVQTPVYYSTFDELPQNHIRVAELVLNRARGLVEMGKDVVILLDSITRLARAYNIALPASGRTLSGGLDTNALHKPKRFLGSARNMQEGGSLTILATALIETGSKMDDVIFEEFKGTGNLELILDRKLSERRIFPSIDIKRSGTRREERLLSSEEYEAVLKLRRALDQNSTNEPVELLSEELMKTKNNEELVKWINKFFLK